MRDWVVAGGLLVGPAGLLLVQNRRRNGSLDWSTPGGVIDEGETLLEGLSREVVEETGLVVARWSDMAYQVEVDFVDRDMTLKVETHVAAGWTGDLNLDDPDGIVVDAAFVQAPQVARRLETGPRWVAEPLTTWLEERAVDETFSYVARGSDPYRLSVERV